MHTVHPGGERLQTGRVDSLALSTPLLEWEWLVFSLVVLTTYLVARLIHWGGRWYLGRPKSDEADSFGQAAAMECYTPLSVSVFVTGVSLSLQMFGLIEAQSLLSNTVVTVLTVVWTYAAIRIGRRWVEVATERGTHAEAAPMIHNFWTLGAVAAGALVVSTVWDLQIAPFLASAGVLGIVIGFAAQDAIRNLISGISLLFDDTYRPGDVVVLDDETRGTVTDIGLRSTTVLTPDNTAVTVPNTMLSETPVVNQSAPQRHIRVDIPVAAAYDTDYDAVERIALEACADAPMVRETPRPRVLLTEFGDSALLFEIQAYVAHPLTENRAIDQLNRRIDDRFAEEGITIPFPQRELSVLEQTNESQQRRKNHNQNETESRPGVQPNE